MNFFKSKKERKKTKVIDTTVQTSKTVKTEPRTEITPASKIEENLPKQPTIETKKTEVAGEIKEESNLQEIQAPPLFGQEQGKSSFWETEKRFPIKPYKPTVNKKLTILLIENTARVQKENANLAKIVSGIVTGGLVYKINYGSIVQQSELLEASSLKNIKLLCDEDIGEKACLFDALLEIERLVSQRYMRVEEKEKEKIMVTHIEVIGIGTCEDTGSKVTKDFGIGCFSRVLKKPKVTTKYFCLTDESFIHAAEVGFHSIGAISRDYQSK